jgi:CRP-like cAMP-binding protein
MNEQQLYDTFGRTFPAGHVLFREGDAGSEMFVIQSGEIEISRRIKDENTVLAVLPAGEFFGEMAIINNRPRSATATVRTEARLLTIDSKTFEAMLRGRIEIAVRLIKTLASRLEQANQQIELLLLRDANHRVVQCLRQLARRATGDSGAAVLIPTTLSALAARVALSEVDVGQVLQKLADARLVVPAVDAGFDEEGFVVPEVGRLLEFLEFLEMKERYSGDADADDPD